jgi:hypothetical protein
MIVSAEITTDMVLPAIAKAAGATKFWVQFDRIYCEGTTLASLDSAIASHDADAERVKAVAAKALKKSRGDSADILDDVLDVLLAKNVIRASDLPAATQAKVVKRKNDKAKL